jgi:RNA polymerase sigma-70 factor (ECF subfamily)
MDSEALNTLISEAQEGSPYAFGRIFDEYSGPIHRFVASRVGRASDAEDLTQLIFVKALEALPRYRATGVPFGGWLFKLARNAVVDHLRAERRQVSLAVVESRAAEDAGPDTVAVLHDDLAAMARALDGLSEDQREVIALRFFAGLSTREAAYAMGRQEGTVRGLQFRAIASLRRSLAGRLETSPVAEHVDVQSTALAVVRARA